MRTRGTAESVRAKSGARHLVGRLMVIAGVLALHAPLGVHAQNQAQTAALARLESGHSIRASANSVEATNAGLSHPGGLAFDAVGNLYIASTSDHVVYEIDLNGVLTTVAGNGEQGFSGDGGAATSAQLDAPMGIAADASGNLYIADSHNNRIRKVSSGVINTIAGTGVPDFSGDGGPATAATLNRPLAVAVDSKGNVYIADTNNNRIREIVGTTITTVAGNGEQTFSGDGGPATSAGLDSPGGVAVDATFNFYIADTLNQRIRMVTAASGIISTLAGTGAKTFTADGTASSAAFARPTGIAVGVDGTIYVADSDNNRIRTISNGTVTTIAGNGSEGFGGDTGTSTNATLDTPQAVAASPTGNSVSFADTDNNRVRTTTGGTINTTGGQSSNGAESLAIGSALTTVYGTGSLTATFANSGQTGTGVVTFYDGLGTSPAVIGSASLAANTAALDTSHLSVGTHYILASYAGDANNAAISSGAYVYVVTPASVTALATGVKMLYGQSVPSLTGTLTGVLAQDTSNVAASFSTAATSVSAPGTYAIAVKLTGSAATNYSVSLGSGTGSVVIAQAPTTTSLALSTATPIYGVPFTLTATVASTTSGTPSGTVSFYSGTTLLNSTPVAVSGSIATLNVASLPIGSAVLTATYNGDTNFLASTSTSTSTTVLAPEFTVATSPAVQSISPSQTVNYTITVTPANSTFVYPVSLSVSGLPGGITASFNPSSLAAGTGTATSTLTLTASANAELRQTPTPWKSFGKSSALALLVLPLFFSRRTRAAARRLSRAGRILVLLIALSLLGAISGCGAGGFYSHDRATYTITVTAVSGPNTHTANVTLTVQ